MLWGFFPASQLVFYSQLSVLSKVTFQRKSWYDFKCPQVFSLGYTHILLLQNWMSLQMTLSKCRNLRQLVKSYAQIQKKQASYKGRTDSLQSLDHTVVPSWLKATDNKYKCHHLTPDKGAGGLDQPTQVTTLPLAHRGRAPLPDRPALTWPPCCLHGRSRRAGADGRVAGEGEILSSPISLPLPDLAVLHSPTSPPPSRSQTCMN